MELRSYIKNRRIELGMSQLDVANAVGVSEGTVSRWESGDISDMRASRIRLLSKTLMISPMVFIGDENSPTLSKDESVGLMNEIFAELSPKNKAIVLEKAKSLLDTEETKSR